MRINNHKASLSKVPNMKSSLIHPDEKQAIKWNGSQFYSGMWKIYHGLASISGD